MLGPSIAIMGVPAATLCAATSLRSDLDRSLVRWAAAAAALELAVLLFALCQMR
jgi:hypothetical protein